MQELESGLEMQLAAIVHGGAERSFLLCMAEVSELLIACRSLWQAMKRAQELRRIQDLEIILLHLHGIHDACSTADFKFETVARVRLCLNESKGGRPVLWSRLAGGPL